MTSTYFESDPPPAGSKDLKGSLSIRPIWHQLEKRIETHILVSFLAYCLHTTLRNLAWGLAAGLTSEAIFEKMSNVHMIDVHLPTTDGRYIVISRYTQPEKIEFIYISLWRLL